MDNSEDKTIDPMSLNQNRESNPADDEESGVGLAKIVASFLRNCWQRRKLMLTIIAIGTSIAVILALLDENRYTSTITFMPPDGASASSSLMSMMSSSSSAASLGSEMLGLNTPGELYVSILQSRNVADGLIARFNLTHYYSTKFSVDARRDLAGDTAVDLDRKSGVITLSVTLEDPVLAAKVTQGYFAELNRVLTEDSASSARRERIFLEGQLKEIKQQLDETSMTLSQFSSKSGTIDMPTQAKSMLDAGLKLREDLIAGRSQLAGLRETYSEDNQHVRAVEARNAELQREIDAMGGLKQGPGISQNSNTTGYPSVSELPALGLTYYDLERKVQVQEALWEALTRQYELAKVEEAEQTPMAHVLDVATVPERKSGPSRRLAVMIGALLSLLTACIAVVTLTIWEGMDPAEEPKKLILDVAGALMDRSRWYWSLPGMRGLRGKFGG